MVWKLMGFGDRDRARDARAREARDCLRERRRSGHLAQALRLEDSDLVHKVFCAMVLSEAVYKQNDEEVGTSEPDCQGNGVRRIRRSLE